MYSYFQTWYASSPANISIDWKAWAEHELKLKPPDEDGDQRTWLQWKMRAGGKMRKEGHRREGDVEVLDVRGEFSVLLLVFEWGGGVRES